MNKLLLVIIAIVLPPLAVGLKAGIGFQLFLNIILTLLVYVPRPAARTLGRAEGLRKSCSGKRLS